MKHDRPPAERVLRVLAEARSATARIRFAPPGPRGVRRGLVEVEREEGGILVVRERGRARLDGGTEIRYSDALRFVPRGEAIELSHLRRGAGRAVDLVRLEAAPDGTWRSAAPHRCGADTYALVVRLDGDEVELAWTVRGPRKGGSIRIRYAPRAHGGTAARRLRHPRLEGELPGRGRTRPPGDARPPRRGTHRREGAWPHEA